LYSSPVIIEENVWIGEYVSILPGVTIGRGSIIGSMSVVNKNIPAFCIAVGAPAKVIKRYNFTTNKWEKE
jgi:lipopolysaccharide O-acetyltransferase